MLVYIPGASHDSGFPLKVHNLKVVISVQWKFDVKDVAIKRYFTQGKIFVYFEI